MKRILLIMGVAALLVMPALPVMAEATAPTVAPVMIDLTPLFQAVIAVLAALITTKLIPWIQARTTETQRERMMVWVRTLVYAAQQLYKNGEIQDRLDYVQEGLLERGFVVDRDVIEAAVRELNLTNGILAPHEATMMAGETTTYEEDTDNGE